MCRSGLNSPTAHFFSLFFFFFTVIEYRKLFFHLIISHLSSWKSMNENFSGRVMDVYLKVITVEKFRNGKTSGARGPRAGRP